jgi:hypothetical protein
MYCAWQHRLDHEWYMNLHMHQSLSRLPDSPQVVDVPGPATLTRLARVSLDLHGAISVE